MGSPENREKWGLPDWLDPPSYGNTKIWSEDRWRWEFTRRRQDYRDDFDLEKVRNAMIAEDLRKADPELIVGALGPTEAAVSGALAKKYGLVFPRLPNPRLAHHPDSAIAFDDYSLRIYYFGSNISDQVPVPKGSMAVVLDLSKTWGKSQRDKIETSFKKAQKDWVEGTGLSISAARAHKRTWWDYLRILDGRECGASWNDLAQVGLADAPANAQKAWTAANRLMFNWPASSQR
jgi:hypothetical protein